KRIMKMKALKLALLAAGLVSGSVSAAFTEGDLAADNSITLNGEIKNTNPVWAWKTGADQTDWDTTKLEWKVTGGNATADFSGKGDVTLLDGYLVNVAAKASLGLQPSITIGGDDYTITNWPGSVEHTVKVKVTGLTDATDTTSTVDGEMTFRTVMASTIGYVNATQNYLKLVSVEGVGQNWTPPANSPNVNFQNAAKKALDNQKLSVDFATAPYATKSLDIASAPEAANVWSAGANRSQITGGVHANINSARVTFPAATIPESWEGALTVTVAYK
ncbi:F4 family fimbrial subunit, partial [Citrobacter sp. VF227]